MVSAPNDRELAGSDARQLRETVEALRQALEDGDALLAAERQRFHAELEAQAEQARNGVAAIRVRLEAVVHERQTAVQAAIARSADEIAQLETTAEALRAALTKAHEDAAAERDAAERAFRAEREQLQEIIAELRARLESVHVR